MVSSAAELLEAELLFLSEELFSWKAAGELVSGSVSLEELEEDGSRFPGREWLSEGPRLLPGPMISSSLSSGRLSFSSSSSLGSMVSSMLSLSD